MKTIYIVNYVQGRFDDRQVFTAFSTLDKNVAIAWVEKYNDMLLRWLPYFISLEDIKTGEVEGVHAERWYNITEAQEAHYISTELR
tara:strand:+ start:159 stop:416 length:258 start_codon:yes stop_codon:yes gene_type:complete